MASIEEIKAGLAASANDGATTVAQIRAAIDAADRMLTRLQAVARGTQHPKVTEALARTQQCKQRLAEAIQLAQAASQGARDYIGHLG